MSKIEQPAGEIDVQCTRCRSKHKVSERELQPVGEGRWKRVCPRCRCQSCFDIRPQVAWCWASGLIEMGDEETLPAGAILIANGPKAYLSGAIAALSRIGRGASEGKFLVPGVPEANSDKAKGDALATWLKWCARNNGHKGRHGVVFVAPNN